jgi:hypothetical protein
MNDISCGNTDYQKFLIEENNYTYYQDRLIMDTKLILVNPNEETEFYSILVANVVDELTTVKDIQEAKSIIAKKEHKFYIIVEHNAKFSETLFIQLMINLDKLNTGISTGDIHCLKPEQNLDNKLINKDLKKYEEVDRPHCTDLTTLRINEVISPWLNNLFAFNTEQYKNPFDGLDNTKFNHYVLVSSGWLWAWLLESNNWDPKEEYLTLYNIDGPALTHVTNLVHYWSPWDQSYVDFVTTNETAKSMMIKAGLIESENDHTTIKEESKERLQSMWDHEMLRWAKIDNSNDPKVGEEVFLRFFRKWQWAEANGKLSIANLNIMSDILLTKKLSMLCKGRSFWFVSNIFASYVSRMWSGGQKDVELEFFEGFKKRLNKNDVVHGSLPFINDEGRIISRKSPQVIK